MSNMKYMQCVFKITDGMKKALEEVPRRGGLYNWLWVHKGSMVQYKDVGVTEPDFEDYDVVQINMSPVDQLLPYEVKKRLKNSSTLLVLNNDYVCEAWEDWHQHPLQYQQVLELGDCTFGTEPYQVSHMLDDTYTIPHPHYIKMLKHIGNDDLDNDKFNVGALFHWWQGSTYSMSLAFQKLKKLHPKIFTRLYAYMDGKDKSKRWQKVMFDKHENFMPYGDFIRGMMQNKLILENCQYHTYGRTSVDTAALRIPTVGTDRVFSMRYLWKDMCADPYDLKKIVNIMDKVLKGGSWLDKQLDYAYENSEFFNYKNSKERYMAMIDETRDRLKK